MPRIDRRDLDDLSFVDSAELQSSGSGDIYKSSVVVLSTTGSSGQVIISGWDVIHDGDNDLQVGDIFFLQGSIPAQVSASFRVDSIIDSASFTVSPSILTSVFGTGSFAYPPGAKSVGISSIGMTYTTASNVQDAFRDIDSIVNARNMDFLLENEPPTPNNVYNFVKTGTQVTQELWKRTADFSLLRSIDYSYSGQNVSSEVRKVFASNGSTVLAQMTLSYIYSGNTLSKISGTRDI